MYGFGKNNGRSPVSQDFIWVAEYYDGTYLAEFDFVTKEESSFYGIDRNKLIRFGLVGHGSRMFFETDGTFNINGKSVDIIYRVGDKDYFLTGHHGKYKDIITYKDAESVFRANGGVSAPKINQFNFGYKAELEVDGVKFHVKPIVKIPFNQPVHVNLWIVADKKLDGELIIRYNNREATKIEAPLKKGVGGEINWIVG